MKLFSKTIMFCVGVLICFASCQKVDEDMSPQNGLLKVLQLGDEYLARNIFENDGELIAICVGNENKLTQSNYGTIPSVMLKLNGAGTVTWKKNLPPSLLAIWKSIQLDNGDLFIVASDTALKNEELTFAILDHLGVVKQEISMTFPTSSNGILTTYLSVDCIQLSGGNIAVVATELPSFTNVVSPHLIILNSNLQIVNKKIYAANNMILDRRKLKFSIAENQDLSLSILGRMYRSQNDTSKHFGFSLKVDLLTLETIHFFPLLNDGIKASISESVSTQDNHVVFVTSQRGASDLINKDPFFLRYIDEYYTGPELTLWNLGNNAGKVETLKISGFPKNGFISKLKKTQDGGFLLLGTCNINSDQAIPSNYRLLLIKLSATFQTEWMIHPNTSGSFLGADVVESNGMYTVFGSYLSFSESFKPIIINITQTGEIQ